MKILIDTCDKEIVEGMDRESLMKNLRDSDFRLKINIDGKEREFKYHAVEIWEFEDRKQIEFLEV